MWLCSDLNQVNGNHNGEGGSGGSRKDAGTEGRTEGLWGGWGDSSIGWPGIGGNQAGNLQWFNMCEPSKQHVPAMVVKDKAGADVLHATHESDRMSWGIHSTGVWVHVHVCVWVCECVCATVCECVGMGVRASVGACVIMCACAAIPCPRLS
jgi:hypothetical protein